MLDAGWRSHHGEDDVVDGILPAAADQRYSPYSVDWRFLPEPLLLAKDFIRYQFVKTGDRVARGRMTRAAWALTVGLRTSQAVVRAGIVFIHVPKTGGTSISSLLYGRNLPHFDAAFYVRAFPELMASLPALAVIREPLARFTSGYRFIAHGGTNIMAADRFVRRRLGGVADVEALIDRLIDRPDLRRQSGIFRDQCSFVMTPSGRLQIDALFALSELGKLPGTIDAWVDRSRLPHINRTHYMPVHLSTRIEDKLRRLYADDFALYDRLVAHDGTLTGRHTLVR